MDGMTIDFFYRPRNSDQRRSAQEKLRELPLSPEDFGARGDGVTDDTSAIQACIDAAGVGGVIALKPNTTYRVNTNANPPYPGTAYGGLQLLDKQVLFLNGARLRALPSAVNEGTVLQAFRKSGFQIVGPGRISGERSITNNVPPGEHGMGIAAFKCTDFVIRDVEVDDCWGDGILVGASINPGVGGDFNERFAIENCHIYNIRRNGISIVAAKKGIVRDCIIHDVDGTAPMAAIDLEPDHESFPNEDITIERLNCYNVARGFSCVTGNINVLLTGSRIVASSAAVEPGANTINLHVRNNPLLKSTTGGVEGGAFRVVAPSLNGAVIEGNYMVGGGLFVIETEAGNLDMVFRNNRIYATNAGCLGVARLLSEGIFTDNVCEIGATAGSAGEQFIQFSNSVEYGRNRYENASALTMYSLVNNSRGLGPEFYASATLKFGSTSGPTGFINPYETATITFYNGWASSGGSDPLTVTKAAGLVSVEGVITSGTVAPGTVLFSLPSGFRPATTSFVPAIRSDLAAVAIKIETNGNVSAVQTVGATYTVINFQFRASGL